MLELVLQKMKEILLKIQNLVKKSPPGNNDTGKRKRRKQRPKQYNNLNEMNEHLKEALRVSEIFIALSFIPLCFKNLLNIIFSGTSFGT